MVVVCEVEVDLRCMMVPLVLCMLFGVAPYHRLVVMVGRAGSECTMRLRWLSWRVGVVYLFVLHLFDDAAKLCSLARDYRHVVVDGCRCYVICELHVLNRLCNRSH